MKRDLNKLSGTEYDLAIVGSGIYGLNAAWDASLRGLKVAVIDKGDFAAATSSNSLKTIHGGLRYLQNLDIKRMRESIYERMVLMRIAPHLVHPLPVVMPTYGYQLKSRPALFVALLANDVIGFDRNRLNDPHKYLPRGRLISRKKIKTYIPGYEKPNLSGGALWFDCQCSNTERLALSYLLSAVKAGADAANYVECTGFLGDASRVTGIRARDTLEGETFEVRAKVVINAAGPWVDNILQTLTARPQRQRFIHSTAMNIIVKRKLLEKHAAGLPCPLEYKRKDGSVYRGSQILFFVPWRDCTMIGTDHLPYDGSPDEFHIDEAQIEKFLDTVNRSYPACGIKREEICFIHSGLLPMAGINEKTGEVRLLKQRQIYDHRTDDKIEGLITIIGVKFTTHRDVASKAVDLVFAKSGRKTVTCKTQETPVEGGDIDSFEDSLKGALQTSPLSERITRRLFMNYGSQYKKILQYVSEDPELGETLPGSEEVLKAEVVKGIREEMARKLSDVVFRRTDLGSSGHPGKSALQAAANLMGEELDWNDSRIKSEIQVTESAFPKGKG